MNFAAASEVALVPLDIHDAVNRDRVVVASEADVVVARRRLKRARLDSDTHRRDRGILAVTVQATMEKFSKIAKLSDLKQPLERKRTLLELLQASFPRETKPVATALPCRLYRDEPPRPTEEWVELVDLVNPWSARVPAQAPPADSQPTETAPCTAIWHREGQRSHGNNVLIHDWNHLAGNPWLEWGVRSATGDWLAMDSLLCPKGGQGFRRCVAWTRRAKVRGDIESDDKQLASLTAFLRARSPKDWPKVCPSGARPRRARKKEHRPS